MNEQLEKIRENQRETWNRFSPGWKKWDEMTMDFLQPMGNEIIRQINPQPGNHVLDIATGTGEPGLTIAKMVKNGKVVLTDLSEGMLEVAKENAEKKGITNIETRLCDAGDLPFDDNSFDAVSCRFGFMFFPDMKIAASEMLRVLKPGGRMVTSVWGAPEENFWVTAAMGTINRFMELPAPEPGAPGMFRCAKPALMKTLFEEVGFKNVTETTIKGKLNCKTVEVYWNLMTEVAAPFVSALSKADDAMRNKIKDEVYSVVLNKFPDGEVFIDSSALVISGEKD